MATKHLLGFIKSVCFIWVGCTMYIKTNSRMFFFFWESNSGMLYCIIARFQRVDWVPGNFFGGPIGTIVKAQLIFIEVQLPPPPQILNVPLYIYIYIYIYILLTSVFRPFANKLF